MVLDIVLEKSYNTFKEMVKVLAIVYDVRYNHDRSPFIVGDVESLVSCWHDIYQENMGNVELAQMARQLVRFVHGDEQKPDWLSKLDMEDEEE